MASRSKKKNNNLPQVKKHSQEYTKAVEKNTKLDNALPFVLIIAIVLLAITFFFPITGLDVSLSADDLTGGNDSTQSQPQDPNASTPKPNAENEKYEMNSSVNTFSIMFYKVNQDGDWVKLLANNMADNTFMQGLIDAYIDASVTSLQRDMIDNVMTMQLVIAIILVVIWLLIIALSIYACVKHKSILPIVILALVFSLITIVEFITLITIALGGSASTSFTVNVGAYIMPIVALIFTGFIANWYREHKHCAKIIKSEEDII